MTWLLAALGIGAGATGIFAFGRLLRRFSYIGWQARDWRAMVALIGSIAGAATLTLLAAWIVWILWRGGWPADTADKRVAALAEALIGLLVTVAIVLVSLGLAITPRSVKGKVLGGEFDMSGGDPVPPLLQERRRAQRPARQQARPRHRRAHNDPLLPLPPASLRRPAKEPAMTTPAPCNACGRVPEFHIAPQPIAGVTLEHVANQCDARSIVIAQSGAEDERDALARRWNAIMVPS